jgi:two-component system sensor histidine kinase/response regulator
MTQDPTIRLRVLLAEDSLVNQILTRRMLERRGCLVSVAKNGREAVAHVAREVHDLVLMDGDMPEMDGFEAAAAIRLGERASGRRVPIIALTGCTSEGDRQRCLAAGMDGYLAKPVDPVVLFEQLDRLAAGRSS